MQPQPYGYSGGLGVAWAGPGVICGSMAGLPEGECQVPSSPSPS